MQFGKKVRKGFIILIISMTVCGCVHTSDDLSSKDSPVFKNSLRTAFRIINESDQEASHFAVGEEIVLELTVTNMEDRSVTYSATSPGHDFIITQGGNRIWSKFSGISFAQVITERIIGPRETIFLNAKWKGVNDAGESTSPGEYTVTPKVVFSVNRERISVPSPKKIFLK